MSSLKRAGVLGATWTGSAAITAIVLRAGGLAVLTRHLEKRDFGLVGIVIAVLGIMQTLGDLGLQNAIVSRQEQSRDRLSSLFWASLTTGILVATAAFALRPILQVFYGEPRLGDLIAWLSLRFVLTGFALPYQALLQRDLQFRTLGLLQVASGAMGTVVAVVAALAGFGIWALVAGELAQSAGLAALCFGVGARRFLPKWRLSRGDLRGYLAFGGAQVGERTFSIYAMNVDYIVIGRVLGPEALGVYSIAFEVASFPNRALNPVLLRVTLPLFARKQHDDAAFARGYVELAKVIAFVQFPLSVVLAVFAPQIMRIFFGASWVASAPLLRILALLGGIRVLCNPAGSVFAAKGRPDVGFAWAASAAVINTLAFVVVVPFGLVATAWAWVALAIMYLVALTRLLGWLTGLSARVYAAALARPLFANLAIWALLQLAWWTLAPSVPEGPAFAMLLIAAAAFYATAAYTADRQFVGRTFELIRDALAR